MTEDWVTDNGSSLEQTVPILGQSLRKEYFEGLNLSPVPLLDSRVVSYAAQTARIAKMEFLPQKFLSSTEDALSPSLAVSFNNVVPFLATSTCLGNTSPVPGDEKPTKRMSQKFPEASL